MRACVYVCVNVCVFVCGLLRHSTSSNRGPNPFTSSDRFPLPSAVKRHCNSTRGHNETQEGTCLVHTDGAAAGILNEVRRINAHAVPVRAAVVSLFIRDGVRCHPHSQQSSLHAWCAHKAASQYDQPWWQTVVTLLLHAKATANYTNVFLSALRTRYNTALITRLKKAL